LVWDSKVKGPSTFFLDGQQGTFQAAAAWDSPGCCLRRPVTPNLQPHTPPGVTTTSAASRQPLPAPPSSQPILSCIPTQATDIRIDTEAANLLQEFRIRRPEAHHDIVGEDQRRREPQHAPKAHEDRFDNVTEAALPAGTHAREGAATSANNDRSDDAQHMDAAGLSLSLLSFRWILQQR